ncbi:unnamed protein product [Arabis nemorensis]|uniref:Zinc finger PHD-type domain-containing protein n=1 Tax=Arabis nemorensis TaxID=586526 RepID=A0A565AQP8_9BRAS|nr:unnamed protein product [Arabis nemorensis]
MGYQYSNDYGFRINEVLALKVLEFMFDPSKIDATVASTSEARVEFDLSSSNTDVLRAILKEIPVSELRSGMPELSKFNLRDVSLMGNQTSAAPSMEANDLVCRDDRSVHMDTCEEEPIDEEQVHIGSEQNINEEDKVVVTGDEDEPMHTNEKDEVIMIDDDTETTSEPIKNGNTAGETFSPSARSCPWPEDARAKCAKDGTWLISGSDDDESDMDHMVKGPVLARVNTNTYTNLLHSSSQTRPENVCWKCEKEGTLLICSRSECAAKVHKECLGCPVDVDEDGNFHCPVCCYDRIVMEYFESQKLMSSAKRKLLKFFPVLSTGNKRLKC